MNCDVCGGNFSIEPSTEAYCDLPMADDTFEESEIEPTICANDGWFKYEHDLNRNLLVHESCFLDKDDVLVRI